MVTMGQGCGCFTLSDPLALLGWHGQCALGWHGQYALWQ